jgi:hypothetical protein
MADKSKTRNDRRPQQADVGGNAPRGDTTGYPEIGEAGGPAGVEPSGGAAATRPREGSGVPEGMTPGDLQKSPEEQVDEWTEE